jgi:hypothetical protein
MTKRDYAFLILGRCGTSDKLIDKYIAELGLPHNETKDIVVDCLYELPRAVLLQFADHNYGVFKS